MKNTFIHERKRREKELRKMVFVLCVGDLHIPHRAADIPEPFKKMLTPGRINAIFLTGNVCCGEAFDYFRSALSS